MISKRKIPASCFLALVVALLIPAATLAQTSPCAEAERHLVAGRSFHAQHNYKSAIVEFRQALKLCPQDHQPLLETVQSELAAVEPALAEKDTRQYLKLEPSSALGHFFLAYSLYQQRRYPDSARAAVATIRVAPQDSKAYVLLGMNEYFMNNFTDSERALNDGLKRQPDNPEAMYFLALAQMGADHFSLAIKTLRQLADKNPNSYQAYDKLGICYQRTGKFEAAAESFRKSEHLAPKSDPASDAPFADHAMMLIDAQRPADAVPLAQEAVKRNPRNAMDQFFLGRALFEAGKPEEAVAPLKQAVATLPSYREAHYMLAKVEQKLGNRDEAAKEFAAVRQIDAKTAAGKEKSPQ